MNTENKQATAESQEQNLDENIEKEKEIEIEIKDLKPEEELEEEFDPETFTIPDELRLEFKVTYDDVVAGLNSSDKVDGTAKKNRNLYLLVGLMCIMEWGVFVYKQHGLSLIMGFIFMGLMIYLKKRTASVNHKIAKEFESEEKQVVSFFPDSMDVGTRHVDYSDDIRVYEFNDYYTMIYQQNHVFVIPKRLLTEKENCAFSRKMKSVLADNYMDNLIN